MHMHRFRPVCEALRQTRPRPVRCINLRCPTIPEVVAVSAAAVPRSAELKEPRTFLRIRPGIFDFEPDLGLKLSQTKPKISGTLPTNRHTTIPNDSGPISACFDDDPKLLNCEIDQPSPDRGGGGFRRVGR